VVRKTSAWATLAAAGVLALAGCGGKYGTSSSSAGSPSKAASSSGVLATARSDLGTIVVNGSGRTVYVFDKDTAGSGMSTCTGKCAALWPAVKATSDSPKVAGVTGDVGTITRSDGTKQVTLDGLPLYTYRPDTHAGDTRGQGFMGVWWVVGPAGSKITGTGSGSSEPSSSDSGGYGSGGY